MSTTPDQTPAEQCEQHPTAPRIDGKCGGCTQYPTDREQPTDRLLVLDGRDALAFVVIRPADEDPERIAVEASARGMSKAVAAYALRQTADQFDRAAIAEGDTPITAEEAAAEQQQRPAVEEQPATDWVADVRAAIAFNRPEREPALETLRDVLLDTAPRSAEQALAAARLILAAHTRDQAAAVRKYIDAYRDEHGVNRSTRGLITGMGSIRRLLDQRADALDAEAQP